MRAQCSFGVRWSLHLALISSALTLIACGDSTAPIVPSKYIVTVSRSTAGAGDTLVVKAQLADANDRSVARSGVSVTWYLNNANGKFTSFQSPTDDEGVASNYFVAGPTPGVNEEIIVSDLNQRQGRSSPIVVVAGAPALYAVTLSNTSPAIGSTVSVTAQLTDRFRNVTPVAGRVVTWSIAVNDGSYYQVGVSANRLVTSNHGLRLSTDGGTFASPTSTTNSQGMATVDFNVGTNASSSYLITANDGHALGYSPAISVRPGPIAKFTVTVSVSDPPAGATVVITANGSDSYGNTVTNSGTAVDWSVTGAGGTLSSTNGTLDQVGYATTRLTTSATPATTYTVTASSPGSSATGTSPTITTLEQVSLASMASGFGGGSSCGIGTDSKVWCWGTHGVTGDRAVPGKPIGDQTVSALSTNAHTCAISAGTVICWGLNSNGQLGDNSHTNRSTPAPISSSLSFTTVSTGSAHTCALSTAGDIYCWGSSADGRLGDGSGYTGLAPIKVAATVSFTAVSAGRAHTCAIATSGDAYCWGINNAGQLGNGSFSSSATPALVTGGLKFTAISAGDSHTCGTAATGVYCWGDNTFGQIGNASTVSSATGPTAVKNSSTFVTVAAGGFHTCALASDGKAFCWGDNSTGELGDPDFPAERARVPIAVTGGFTFKSIAVGGGADASDYYYGPVAFGYSCAITTGGIAYCWGHNGQGELGTSVLDVSSSGAPVKVDGQH